MDHEIIFILSWLLAVGLDLSCAVEWGKPLSQKTRWDSNYQPLVQPNDQWSSVPDFWRNIMFHQMNSNTQWNGTNEINFAALSASKTTFTGKFTDLECKGDQDCHKENVTLSCMGASPKWSGRCMPPLKPMEHGCLFDDQCRKTCQESFCAMEQKFKNAKGENQCRCNKGFYYLWKKCWNNCLPGTLPVHVSDDHWVCQEVNSNLARKYYARNKRETQRRMAC